MDIDVSKLSTGPKTDVNKLFVSVYLTNTLEKPAFKGFVKSLTSFDDKGPFDILPMHENFVTKFKKKLEIVPEEGEKVVYKNAIGVIEVASNVVRVFLEDVKEELSDSGK